MAPEFPGVTVPVPGCDPVAENSRYEGWDGRLYPSQQDMVMIGTQQTPVTQTITLWALSGYMTDEAGRWCMTRHQVYEVAAAYGLCSESEFLEMWEWAVGDRLAPVWAVVNELEQRWLRLHEESPAGGSRFVNFGDVRPDVMALQ
jgi:hypothetical protein